MKVLTQCFPLHLENLVSSTKYHSKPKRVLLVAFSGRGVEGGGQCYTHTWASKPESESVVTQLCPTLCNPMKYSPPGSSVHGILQASALEWIAIPFSRGSSQPRDRTWISHNAGRFFPIRVTREAHKGASKPRDWYLPVRSPFLCDLAHLGT